MAADSCGMEVSAGPAEATVLGNVLVQLLATGKIESLEQGRRVMANMPDLKRYHPKTRRPGQNSASVLRISLANKLYIKKIV